VRGVVARRVVGRRRSVSRSSSVVSLGVVEAYHGRIRTGRMMCSQLSGNGEVERAHKITGGTYTKVNPNALLVPVG